MHEDVGMLDMMQLQEEGEWSGFSHPPSFQGQRGEGKLA
jgi:hypothetical protein